MELSPHFQLSEFTKSATATRLGIDNTPSDLVKARLQQLCVNVLEPVREEFGPVRISSGYRCLELNDVLKSKPTSEHILGQAADFEVSGVHNIEVAKWIRDHLQYNQLLLEFYDFKDPNSGWVHCSYCEGRNRNQVLTVTHRGAERGLPNV